MSEEIIKILDALTNKFGIVIDWTSENIIPYMQQLFEKYINYEIATSVGALIFAVILFVCAIFGIKLTKYFNSRSDDDFILATFIGVLTIC